MGYNGILQAGNQETPCWVFTLENDIVEKSCSGFLCVGLHMTNEASLNTDDVTAA
jgi:hypothetical protein